MDVTSTPVKEHCIGRIVFHHEVFTCSSLLLSIFLNELNVVNVIMQ